jgi:chaperonin GroES
MFTPLDDRVLVQRTPSEEKTAGGLIVPDTAKEKPIQATVIAVGPGRLTETGTRIAPSLKPGDTVVLGKWSGTDLVLNGEEFTIAKESDIFGIITKE